MRSSILRGLKRYTSENAGQDGTRRVQCPVYFHPRMHNGVIKTCGVTSKKVKTGVVLYDSIPGVLAIAAQDVATTAFGHICTGPLLSAVVSRAFVHVAEGAHYDYTWIENGKVINRSMWFNSSKYRQKPDEPPSHRVTETRVNRYLKGKAGEITKNCKVEGITLMYQSLHEVEFLKPAEQHTALMLKLEPEIQLETIGVIRSLYRCDCKAFWNKKDLRLYT